MLFASHGDKKWYNYGMIRSDQIQLSKAVGLKRNPKDHNIGEINTSVSRFGFLERVLINELTGHIISGHGRIEALRNMKVKGGAPPENITVEGNEWLVPCDYVQIPEEEEEAAAIALNRLVESGGWNEGMLTDILSDLAALGPENLDGIGFDTDDLDKMLRDIAGPEERGSELAEETEIDDYGKYAQDMLDKWQVKDGDIWEIDGHIVACVSCTDIDGVKEVFSGNMANLVFTSPPYAEQRKKQYGGVREEDYVQWWSSVQDSVHRILADDGSFFVNIKPHTYESQRSLYVIDMVASMVREHGWLFIDEFCWQRIGNPGSWPNRFKNGFEPVYHFAKQRELKFRPKSVSVVAENGVRRPGKRNNMSTGNYYNLATKALEWDSALPSNVLPTYGNAIGWTHAAAFPLGLPEFFILAFTDSGDLVYDPFAGSGTTGVSAHVNGRKSIMTEILPEYTAIILERMMQTTLVEPTRIKG